MTSLRSLRSSLLLPAALAPALLVAGCAGGDDVASDGILNVVASTDVWGDVAASIGGDRVVVTSIIDRPGVAPHEYEASARDQLAVSRADLLIKNGGGYDPFFDTLVEASGSTAPAVDAVTASGRGGANEHVWYDLVAVGAVAEAVAGELTGIDPGGADTYAAALADFQDRLTALQERSQAVRTQAAGRSALATEPVPLALLAALGLTDITPTAFAQAVEEDSDVPASTLDEVLDLVAAGDVALLGYNSQASTVQAERVRQAAEAAGVPVVDFAETLPDGQDYLGWMAANIDAVVEALGE